MPTKATTKKIGSSSNMTPGFDGHPPEFVEQRIFTYEKGVRKPMDCPVNINTDRITYLFNHGRIEERQYLAARQLEEDWQLSLIQPAASSTSGGGGHRGGDFAALSDAKIDALRRHGDARAALGMNWAIIELVVEQHLSVEKAASVLRCHRMEAMGALKSALHQLADFYGIG
jgi:hypothetical protein